jgi:hypothetical protein
VSRADELRANDVRASELCPNALRERIRGLVGEYYREAFPAAEFVPGSSPVFPDVYSTSKNLNYWLSLHWISG